jgi:hypothetical protein
MVWCVVLGRVSQKDGGVLSCVGGALGLCECVAVM